AIPSSRSSRTPRGFARSVLTCSSADLFRTRSFTGINPPRPLAATCSVPPSPHSAPGQWKILTIHVYVFAVKALLIASPTSLLCAPHSQDDLYFAPSVVPDSPQSQELT